MGLIESFRRMWSPEPEEEPLCPLPVGDEAIEFDEDEQAGIDSSMREFHENEVEATNNRLEEWVMDGRYMQLLSEIRKHDTSNSGADEHKSLMDDRLQAETEVSYYLRGLKRAAYSRYGDGKLIPAAQTCIKAFAMLSHFKRTTGYSGDGEAEVSFMLAHMHACGSRFRVAKRLLNAAKREAGRDGCIRPHGGSPRLQWDDTVTQSMWAAKVDALGDRIKSKVPPNPISNLSEADFIAKDGTYFTGKVNYRDST